jgi:hypothetical protein
VHFTFFLDTGRDLLHRRSYLLDVLCSSCLFLDIFLLPFPILLRSCFATRGLSQRWYALCRRLGLPDMCQKPKPKSADTSITEMQRHITRENASRETTQCVLFDVRRDVCITISRTKKFGL